MSAALAGSIFERLGVAENRLLMQPLTSSSRFATSDGVMLGTSIWDQCDSDIWKIYGALVRAMKEASLAAVKRGDDTYMNQWLAAWVSSPVAARHADTHGRVHLPGEGGCVAWSFYNGENRLQRIAKGCQFTIQGEGITKVYTTAALFRGLPPEQLEDWGRMLWCCNPGCTNLSGPSELQLKTFVCAGGCGVRYCSRECQVQGWRLGHRHSWAEIVVGRRG